MHFVCWEGMRLEMSCHALGTDHSPAGWVLVINARISIEKSSNITSPQATSHWLLMETIDPLKQFRGRRYFKASLTWDFLVFLSRVLSSTSPSQQWEARNVRDSLKTVSISLVFTKTSSRDSGKINEGKICILTINRCLRQLQSTSSYYNIYSK